MLLFSFGSVPITFYIGSLIFGIYTGTFSFYLVFHSLVHPEKSAKYLSVNETIVGVTGMFSPVIAGVIANMVNVRVPYLLCAIVLMIIVVIKFAVMRKVKL